MLAIEWSQGIEDAWSDVATFVPKVIACLAILFVGWIVARMLAKAARKLLDRAGLDKAMERAGLDKALDERGYNLSAILGKAIFYLLMLVVLQMAFGVFGENAVSDMLHAVVAYIPKAVVAVVIVVIAAAVASFAKELIIASLGGLSYGTMLGTLAYVGIVVVGAFAALNQLEIAPEIVNGLFYAILAVVAGSAIVAVGGGGIQPMRQRWEKALNRYDAERPKVQEHMRTRRASKGEMVEGQGEVDLSRSETERPTYTGQ